MMPDGRDYESLYRDEIIRRLDKLDKTLEDMRRYYDEHNSDLAQEIAQVRVDLSVVQTTLNLKAGVWGALSGVAAGGAMLIGDLLLRAGR